MVFCRLPHRLALRNLSEITLLRGFTVSHESIRRWEAKLLPVMGEALRKRRHGRHAVLARVVGVDRPHDGIECLNWAVINQDWSRPCPRLSVLASTRPRPSLRSTASTMLAGLCCRLAFAAFR